ncbi:MAG: hypothetical protein HY553_12800 [Elusimicrobia bacterium]|nr:hypothetical protein [Elusimicrobiota bacterium]
MRRRRSLSAFDPKPLGFVLGGAVVVYFVMRRFGREGRHYSVAGAGAALILGLDYAYGLPLYAYLAGILLAPFVYHRGVKKRMQAALSGMGPVQLPDLGIRLVRCPDGSGKYLAMWRAEPLEQEESTADTGSIMARPSLVAEVAQGSLPSSLLVALEFEGEMDDDYDIIFSGDAPKGLSGQLMLCHRESVGSFTHIHEEHQEVENLPGAEAWMCVRSEPPGYAFRLIDARAFEILHELFEMQSEERQMYTVIEGDKIRIVSTRTFNAEELERLITWGSRWIQKVRETE